MKLYYCSKYNSIPRVEPVQKMLCEDCEDNPKVSTGIYKECKQLNVKENETI